MTPTPRCAVIGPGRLGTVLHRALTTAGVDAGTAPLGRGATGEDAEVVLLCVPDREIVSAAAVVVPGPLVVHTSGAGSVDLVAPWHHRRGVLHPLLSVPTGDTPLAGARAAVRATTEADADLLRALARSVGLVPLDVADADRTAYHAAASLASNALVALHLAAADLAATAGVPADALHPLATAALAQVQAHGSAALTGPVARGDWSTVAAQRAAVADRTPHLLALFDAMTDLCAEIAGTTPSLVPTEPV